MIRPLGERYAVGAFAFMAAATWLGIGLIHGFICLAVSVAGFQAMRIWQRRHVVAQQSRRPQRTHRRTADRPRRPAVYDTDAQDGWLAAGDGAW